MFADDLEVVGDRCRSEAVDGLRVRSADVRVTITPPDTVDAAYRPAGCIEPLTRIAAHETATATTAGA